MDNNIANWTWARKEDRKQLRRQFTGALLVSGAYPLSNILGIATELTDELLALEATEEAEVKDEAR